MENRDGIAMSTSKRRDWEIKSAASLSEQAYDILWTMVSTGELSPQERVSDSRLADLIGVSRTPVREAMSKLERDGILVKLARGGYQVRSVRETDIRGMYNCRAALEGLAAREAAENISDDEIVLLRTLVDNAESMVAEYKVDKVIELNRHFHDLIIQRCENYYLQELVNSLHRLTNFNRHNLANLMQKTPEGVKAYRLHMTKNIEDHRDILEAIAARNPDEAELRMRKHLRYTGDSMARLFVTTDGDAD